MAAKRAAGLAPNWSALPMDVMYRVVGRLPVGVDRLRAAKVCRQWRAAVRRRRRRHGNGPVVYLALVDGKVFSFPGAKPARPSRCPGYLGVCNDQLLFEDREYCCYRLVSPFTGRATALPNLSSIRDEQMSPDMSIRKMIVRPDGLIAAIVGREHFAKVALCSLEHFSWSVGAGDQWRWYEDMVYHDGKLYALVANGGDLLAFDLGYEDNGEAMISGVKTVITGSGYSGLRGMRYLVKSRSGELLMVNKIMNGAENPYAFELYKAVLQSWGSSWERVTPLDCDEALFVGRLSSRAVHADREGFEGYQIFFLDDTVGMSSRTSAPWVQPSHHAGVYDMLTGNITKLLPRESTKNEGPSPATWLFPEDSDDDDE
ncbi:uncharacterized protein [Lolium perenne]|uniref:uncharacterized protein n=1 Tax=Lolium perenne TaxID=4522 RepID=UPI0021EB4150|nr:uncharacterized protein LOC127347671 [Lolium perenne]